MADRVSPWVPMKDPLDLKHLGKFVEELGECTAAAGRCLVQGMMEPHIRDPAATNRDKLMEEIGDVLANAELVVERFKMYVPAIENRVARKKTNLRVWHAMTPTEGEPQ